MRHGGAPRNLCGGVIGVSTCEALRGCGTGLREKNMSIPRDFYAQRTPDRPLNDSIHHAIAMSRHQTKIMPFLCMCS